MGWSILSKFSFTHPHWGICVCRMQENWWWMITAVFLIVLDTWNINFFYELCSKQTILPLIGKSWISKGFHWNLKDFLSGSRFWVGIWNQSFMFHTFSKLFHFYFENYLREKMTVIEFPVDCAWKFGNRVKVHDLTRWSSTLPYRGPHITPSWISSFKLAAEGGEFFLGPYCNKVGQKTNIHTPPVVWSILKLEGASKI